MSRRNLLHKTKLKAFLDWAVAQGCKVEIIDGVEEKVRFYTPDGIDHSIFWRSDEDEYCIVPNKSLPVLWQFNRDVLIGESMGRTLEPIIERDPRVLQAAFLARTVSRNYDGGSWSPACTYLENVHVCRLCGAEMYEGVLSAHLAFECTTFAELRSQATPAEPLVTLIHKLVDGKPERTKDMAPLTPVVTEGLRCSRCDTLLEERMAQLENSVTRLEACVERLTAPRKGLLRRMLNIF